MGNRQSRQQTQSAAAAVAGSSPPKFAGEDIEIAQSVAPVHIAKIAHALGLRENEFEQYGSTKAKVMTGGLLRGVGVGSAHSRSSIAASLAGQAFSP